MSAAIQLDHYQTLGKMPNIRIDCVLLVCGVSSENLGLIARSADVFGAKAIYCLQGDAHVNSKKFSKPSRGSNIPVHFIHNTKSIKEQGYQIVALEVTNNSVSLRQGEFQEKICLVVGNEQKGVPEGILNEAEKVCHIEMIGGHISSLNVSVATSIALYEISQFFINRQCAPPLYGQALS